ncbi:hypothetical protein [Streptomyces sp. WM6386]
MARAGQQLTVTCRVETAQQAFLQKGSLDLDTPLKWKVYGDSCTVG